LALVLNTKAEVLSSKPKRLLLNLANQFKNLAGAIGIAFGTRAIINFARASVKASLEASAQQERLARLLTVTNDASTEQIAVLTSKLML
jgi:hypothetical protein